MRPPQNPRVNRLGVANPKDYFPDTPVAPARSANDEIEDAIDARGACAELWASAAGPSDAFASRTVNGRKTLETPSAPQRRVAKETVASSDPEEEIEEEREEEETPKPAKTADIPVARDSEAHEAPAAEASSSRRTTRGRKSSIEPVQEVEEAELVLSKVGAVALRCRWEP